MDPLEAMYELQKQGYKDITLELRNEDKVLILGCNEGHEEYTVPVLEIDDIDSWAQPFGQESFRKFDYWWIFD